MNNICDSCIKYRMVLHLIKKCIVITSPALHAFVLVLNVAARYQFEENF